LRILVGIGLISYSAYLWHQPLFAFARLRSLAEPSHALMGALALLSLFLAWGTWRFVEQPFRKGPEPLLPTRRRVFIASGVAGALLAAVGLTGATGLAAQYRYSADELALVETAAWSPMRERCHYGRGSDFAAEDSCVFFGDRPSIAVYGNSHGVELAYGLAGHLRETGQFVQQLTVSGCPASYGRDADAHCADFYRSRLDYLRESEQIRHVLLTFRTDRNGPEAAGSVVDLANFLDEAGKQVIVVLQAPTLPSDISSYILNALQTNRSDIPSRTREAWAAENQHMVAELRRLNPGVSVVDIADAFCREELCFAVRDGEALFFDDHHMSNSGASLAAPLIAPALDTSARR
jgi:hypothetical protein